MQESADTSQPQRFDRAKPWRSEKYLEFVRSRPCVVTGKQDDTVVAHHIRCLGGGGTGLKPPDWLCVPIVASEHHALHNHGEKSYWIARGIDPMEHVALTLLVYLAQQEPTAQLVSALAAIITEK